MNEEIKKTLDDILAAVKGLEGRIDRVERGSISRSADVIVLPEHIKHVDKKMSMKEFLIEKGPTNGVQMTLAIAYFLETQEGLTSFNTADLEQGFRSAKETVPGNINDKVNMCVKNGHLMEEKEKKDSKKAWVVTRSGEQQVESGFKKEGSK